MLASVAATNTATGTEPVESAASAGPGQSPARPRPIPVNDQGEIIVVQFAALLSGRTRIVSVTHIANALGTIHPVSEFIALSHAYGVLVLVDAAQSSPRIFLDV